MKSSKINGIINFISKYCLIIISIIIGIIGIISIFVTAYFNTTYNTATEVTYFKFSFGILEIMLTLFFLSLIVFTGKKIIIRINTKLLVGIILIIMLSLFIVWINIIKLEPIDDQKRIHEMAIDMINGKIGLHFVQPMYLFLYPYQIGIVSFVSIFYKIFGQNFLNFQYINSIFSITNLFLLFLISKEIFKDNGEDIEKYLIILLTGFGLYFVFFNVYFYGNIVGFSFALLSIYFILKYLSNNKVFLAFLSGVFISVSIILKTNYNIFLCGIAIIVLLDLLKNWKKRKLLAIALFIIAYLIINFSFNICIRKIYDIKMPEGVPMINFIYMGMSDKIELYPGWYNGDTLDIYYRNNLNYESSSKEAKELIKNRIIYFLNNSSSFIEYYAKKIGSTWLNPTFQTVWVSTPGARYEWDTKYAEYLNNHQKVLSIVSGNLYKIIEKYFDIYQIIIFIFGSIGIFILSRNDRIEIKKLLLPIIFLGGFLFHIIWETKAIYVLQYYYLLLPFSAYGIYKISKLNITKE